MLIYAQCSDRFGVVLVLVYFMSRCRNLRLSSLRGGDSNQQLRKLLIPAKSMVHLANVFLLYLLSKDVFIQDIATLGLCHAYAYCKAVDDDDDYNDGDDQDDITVTYATASTAISNNVIACITKERRSMQPVGFSVDPEQGNRQQQQRHTAMLAATLLSNSSADVLSSLETSNNDDLARVAREMRDNNREQGDTNTGGERRGDNINQGSQTQVNTHGVHAEVCRIAKKSGDGSTVFKFLSMVKCDPSFGVGISNHILQKYAAPEVTIDDNKIDAIIPLLYQAKYHPSTSVRNVMKGLWTALITRRTQNQNVTAEVEEASSEETILMTQQQVLTYTIIHTCIYAYIYIYIYAYIHALILMLIYSYI